MGGARERGDAPADAGAAGRPPLPRVPGPVPDRRRLRGGAGRRRRAASGRASATTAAPSVCTPRARVIVEDGTAGPSRRDYAGLAASPASGRTRRGRCWRSPSRPTSPWSTPTWHVCWRAWAGAASTAGEVQRLADAAVPHGRGWAWNQAALDLGALVCRRRPRCTACPLRAGCRWQGSCEPDPAVAPRASAPGSLPSKARTGRVGVGSSPPSATARCRAGHGRGDGLARRPTAGRTGGGDTRRRRPRRP